MKNTKTITTLAILIGVLALFAVLMGLFWQAPGEPREFISARGERVTLSGHGLYQADTVSLASQAQAADLVTLVLGLPLLAVSTGLAKRGSLRGRLLQTGTLGYFLYTYMSMAFGAAYNSLFLVYVTLFSLGLFAFILSLMSYDLVDLPQHFSDRLPRKGIAVVLLVAGGFLLLAWMGRIVPPLLQGTLPPLENMTTLVIQVMDLGLIVPMSILGGVLLLRRSAWGYLIGSVAALKLLTMGTSVSAMAINLMLVGAPISMVELVVFPSITLVNFLMVVLLLKNIQGNQASPVAA